MQKQYTLISSKDSFAGDFIRHDCSFAINQANLDMFFHGGYNNSGLTDDVKKAFKDK